MRRHNKSLIVAIVAAATLGLMALDQTHMTRDEPPTVADVPSSTALAPDVTFALLDGGSISLHSLAGHTVWLHFWASWCIPCREEFASLLKRMQQKDDQTILLAVSGDAKAEDAKRFIAPLKHDFKALFDSGKVIIAHDPDHKLIEGTFQTFQYPETIIIDKNLIMQRKIIGIFSELPPTVNKN